jgi:cytochrome c-type biogenesis protein CcmE
MMKFLICSVLIIISIVFLFSIKGENSFVYFFTVAELDKYTEYETPIRISGLVKPGTIEYTVSSMLLTFEMYDKGNSTDMVVRVQYRGVKPDLLKDHSPLIAEGHLTKGDDSVSLAKVFKADTILTQCPSKYEVE